MTGRAENSAKKQLGRPFPSGVSGNPRQQRGPVLSSRSACMLNFERTP